MFTKSFFSSENICYKYYRTFFVDILANHNTIRNKDWIFLFDVIRKTVVRVDGKLWTDWLFIQLVYWHLEHTPIVKSIIRQMSKGMLIHFFHKKYIRNELKITKALFINTEKEKRTLLSSEKKLRFMH